MRNDGTAIVVEDEPEWKTLLNHDPPKAPRYEMKPTISLSVIKQATERNKATRVPAGRIRKSRHNL